MKRIVIAILIAGTAFFSCKENSFERQRKNELNYLNEYMRAHHAGVEPRRSGLFFFELEPGTGDSIKIEDRVQIFYTIWTLDTILVHSSGNYEPLELVVQPASQLSSSPRAVGGMRALHEALIYMRGGSRAMLIFDSSLGFGQNGAPGIVGGFTPLRMEVFVDKVYPAQTPSQ